MLKDKGQEMDKEAQEGWRVKANAEIVRSCKCYTLADYLQDRTCADFVADTLWG